MQSQWRAIGVEATIHNVPARTFFGETLKKREFTGLAEFSSTLEPTLVPWSRLSSQWIPSEANNWAGQNYSGVNDKRLDALIDAAQFELDPANSRPSGRKCSGSTPRSFTAFPSISGRTRISCRNG